MTTISPTTSKALIYCTPVVAALGSAGWAWLAFLSFACFPLSPVGLALVGVTIFVVVCSALFAASPAGLPIGSADGRSLKLHAVLSGWITAVLAIGATVILLAASVFMTMGSTDSAQGSPNLGALFSAIFPFAIALGALGVLGLRSDSAATVSAADEPGMAVRSSVLRRSVAPYTLPLVTFMAGCGIYFGTAIPWC